MYVVLLTWIYNWDIDALVERNVMADLIFSYDVMEIKGETILYNGYKKP
jgi:hypothetical protein